MSPRAHYGLSGQQAGQTGFVSEDGVEMGRLSPLPRGCTIIWLLMGPMASALQEEQSNSCGSHSWSPGSIPESLVPSLITYLDGQVTQTYPVRNVNEVGLRHGYSEMQIHTLVEQRAQHLFWRMMERRGIHVVFSLVDTQLVVSPFPIRLFFIYAG